LKRAIQRNNTRRGKDEKKKKKNLEEEEVEIVVRFHRAGEDNQEPKPT